MDEGIENFEEIAAKGEVLYRSFAPVRCPYFNEEVHFTSQGLEHLKFKATRKARPRHDQYMRFRLLHMVPEVLKNSRTLQGTWSTMQFERVRMHSRTENILKQVTYYEFIAVIGSVRVKVIVKQVENGPKYFWSLIPFWGAVRGGEGVRKRRLYGGNPEED